MGLGGTGATERPKEEARGGGEEDKEGDLRNDVFGGHTEDKESLNGEKGITKQLADNMKRCGVRYWERRSEIRGGGNERFKNRNWR